MTFFRLLTPVSSPQGKMLRNGEILAYYEQALNEATQKRQTLDRARRTSTWRRVLGYPLIMLSLLVLTGLSLLCVIMNVGQIVAGFRSLPVYQTAVVDLGITSLSSLGVIGVIIEVILIGYLFITSMVGLYMIPIFSKFFSFYPPKEFSSLKCYFGSIQSFRTDHASKEFDAIDSSDFKLLHLCYTVNSLAPSIKDIR